MPPADKHFDIRNVSMDTDLEPKTVPFQVQPPKNKQALRFLDFCYSLYRKKRFLPGPDAI